MVLLLFVILIDVLETRLIDYFAIITPVSRTCTYYQPFFIIIFRCDPKTNTYYCDCDISYRYPQKDFKDFEFPTKLEWFAFPSIYYIKHIQCRWYKML